MIVILNLDENKSKNSIQSSIRNETANQRYRYEGHFHYFTAYSNETTRIKFKTESTTLIEETIGVSISKIKATIHNNSQMYMTTESKSKILNTSFLTNQEQVNGGQTSKTHLMNTMPGDKETSSTSPKQTVTVLCNF